MPDPGSRGARDDVQLLRGHGWADQDDRRDVRHRRVEARRDVQVAHARRKRLQVTPRSASMSCRTGEAIFDELRDQWERQISAGQLKNLERHLATLVGEPSVPFDTPGWMTRDLGEPD